MREEGFVIIIPIVIIVVFGGLWIKSKQMEKRRNNKLRLRNLIIALEKIQDTVVRINLLPLSKVSEIALTNETIEILKKITLLSSDPKFKTALRIRKDNVSRLLKEPSNNRLHFLHFSAPDDKKRALELLRGLKELNLILRVQSSRGSINLDELKREQQQIEIIKLKVSIDNALAKTRVYLKLSRLEESKDILKKINLALKDRTDSYSIKKISETTELFLELKDKLENRCNASSSSLGYCTLDDLKSNNINVITAKKNRELKKTIRDKEINHIIKTTR